MSSKNKHFEKYIVDKALKGIKKKPRYDYYKFKFKKGEFPYTTRYPDFPDKKEFFTIRKERFKYTFPDFYYLGPRVLGKYSRVFFQTRKREYNSKNRDKQREWTRTYAERNRQKILDKANIRRLTKATPKRLSEECKKQIKAIYKERRRLSKLHNIVYHVDHIIPIINDRVCGLHVPWNLRIITAEENLKKSNKLIPLD